MTHSKKQSFYEFMKEASQWIEDDTFNIDNWQFRELCEAIDDLNSKKKNITLKKDDSYKPINTFNGLPGTYARGTTTIIIDDPNSTSDNFY